MYIGADYYPEHWPRETWETTADQMKAAGFNVTRVAEFSWVNCEPEEGRFEFAWLDDAIRVLGSRGIKVIIGTPTAVMPAWVARKYPETLAMKPNGQRTTWGVRKNNCFTSGAFRLLSERITQAMAERYAGNADVIGWQTDNEFGNNSCSCSTCRADFHDWLRAKHKTLDALNAAWGTHFWGHRYGEWAEIPIPDDIAAHNPGLLLDWQRYGSWLNVRFQRDQVRILRRMCPKQQFITHNLMGYHSDLDYYDLAEDLDFVSWDNYPVWGKPEVSYDAAGAADVMRGLKRKNFWIMEQTAGPCGWGEFGRNVRPGELRKIAYQQVAHGADGMVWFRWRTCTVGREQYWHGLLGHDGKPGRRYAEAAQTAKELHALWPLLDGTTVKASVAIVYDYESIWATRFQKSFSENNWHHQMRNFQAALLRAGINVDMVRPGQDLAGYRMVVAPELYLLPDVLARQLDGFVRGGGVLVTGIRTGVKDEHSRCHARTLPGLLSDALGIRIDEYESLGGGIAYPVKGAGDLAGSFTADCYADWVTTTTAEKLVGYEPWHVASYAAATRNRCGKGWGYYVGANVKEEAFFDALMRDAAAKAGVAPVVAPPAGVEASVREGGGRKLLFLVNHGEEPKSVAVPAGATAQLGEVKDGKVELGAYGVAVLKIA
jgi:beta-galactosidase